MAACLQLDNSDAVAPVNSVVYLQNRLQFHDYFHSVVIDILDSTHDFCLNLLAITALRFVCGCPTTTTKIELDSADTAAPISINIVAIIALQCKEDAVTTDLVALLTTVVVTRWTTTRSCWFTDSMSHDKSTEAQTTTCCQCHIGTTLLTQRGASSTAYKQFTALPTYPIDHCGARLTLTSPRNYTQIIRIVTLYTLRIAAYTAVEELITCRTDRIDQCVSVSAHTGCAIDLKVG